MGPVVVLLVTVVCGMSFVVNFFVVGNGCSLVVEVVEVDGASTLEVVVFSSLVTLTRGVIDRVVGDETLVV